MPAPKALGFLPKPLLFGLYGALGGLLGALAFGELLWYLLAPPPPPPVEPRVALAASSDLIVYPGGTNRLFVQVAREGFDGPVTVTATGLPAGVTATDLALPEKQTEGELVLRAAPGAPPTTSVALLKVTATARAGNGSPTASAQTQLNVLPAAMPQADIVFVLDVTGSMQGQIDGLKDGIGTFANDLYRAKVDARFACLAFRDLTEGEPSQWLRFKGESFTADAGAFAGEVGRLRASGGGDAPESSFEALVEAAELREFRKSAVRALVLITDAPPKAQFGQGLGARAVADALRTNRIDSLHLVVNPAHLDIYREARAGALGVGDDKALDRGKEFDLNRVAGDRTLMTTRLMPEMTRAIVAAAESKRPAPPDTGTRPQVEFLASLQSSRAAAAGSEGKLVAQSAVWTGAIAALVCLFLVAGQHHYLRGAWPAAGGVVLGLLGGLAAGAAGGAAGQGLYLLAPPDSAFLGTLVRVMGWTLLGALAGAGLAPFVPNLKLQYGLAGGAIGGTAGALAFLAAESAVGDRPGRLAGGLALGFCIGLMVAVVEAAFRRAWLEVRYGPREAITVNLGPEPVKVGGDARACTVWARGAADIALRYFVRDGQVICTDVPNRDERAVGDGDTREVGNVTVVVRTGTGAAPSAPPRPAPPPVAKPQPKPAPLTLDDDLPVPMPPPPAAPRPVAPPPPAAAPKPPVPPAPKPAAPVAAPAIKPAARDPDACPTCGRKTPGRPGARYCMVCDQTY